MKRKKIYAKLRYMREKFGINQETFAKLIGCGIPNYANKEHGRVPWALEDCFEIRDYINKLLIGVGENPVTVDELFQADVVTLTQPKGKAVNR